MLNDRAFLRYSRQLLLEQIGPQGQERLSSATVLVAGLGGLGSPAALYLAAAGVGTLLLADDDKLDVSNLQRQILYRTGDIAQPKAQAAERQLTALNPLGRYLPINSRLAGKALDNAVAQADIVLDCSDNMPTRHAINAACVRQEKTLISASAVAFGGQLMAFRPPYRHGCYACLFPDAIEPERNCRTAGVLGPVVGIMGAMQALEAIKMICGMASSLDGQLRLFDAQSMNWRSVTLAPSPDCPVCAKAVVNGAAL